MINFTKLLKIGLPVTTLTAATIITATLLFSKREDLKLTNINEETLENYDKELDPYKEELMKQADQPETDEEKNNQDAENENKELNEQEKQAEEQIKEQLKDPNTKELIKELLNQPEKLAERLSLENKLTQEQVKKIASRIQKLEEESQGSAKVDAPDEEQGALETESESHGTEDVNSPSEKSPPAQPEAELSEDDEDLVTRVEAEEIGGPKQEDPAQPETLPKPDLLEEKEGLVPPKTPIKEEPSSDGEDTEDTVLEEDDGKQDLAAGKPELPKEDLNSETREGDTQLSEGGEPNSDTLPDSSDPTGENEEDSANSHSEGGSEDGHAEGTGEFDISLEEWQEIGAKVFSTMNSLGLKIRNIK